MTKERVALIAGILISLFVLGMATYGANQMVNNFFDKNVISPKGVIQTFQLQKPRLWVDKETYNKEQVENALRNAGYDETNRVIKEYQASPTPKPRSLKIGEVLAAEYTWNDAIRQVFPADEAGRMIRICLKEHKGWKGDPKYALNEKNKNGSWDYGWCQVNSAHKPKGMSDETWKTNLQDPMFHAKQVRAIYLSQGWNAWSVYKFGLVN